MADDALLRITRNLERHRQDAKLIKQSRLLRTSLGPHLAKYGEAGSLLMQWSQDSILAGCRRLIDDSGSSRSLVRTLRDLHAEAKGRGITDDRLAQHWVASGWRFDDPPKQVAARVLTDISERDTRHLSKKVPTRDMTALTQAHSEVVRAATKSVAHDDPSAAFVLPAGKIDDVVDDVIRLALRWSRLADGVETRSIGGPHLDGLEPIVYAVRLFRWEEYVDARAQARKDGLSPVDADARLEYRFQS